MRAILFFVGAIALVVLLSLLYTALFGPGVSLIASIVTGLIVGGVAGWLSVGEP